VAWKAHSNAAEKSYVDFEERRPARLFQTSKLTYDFSAKAVLEQPFSSCEVGKALGRRNIAPIR